MHLVQVGVAAGGEGAEQVQFGGGLEIAELHPRRIGRARGGREIRAVDDVAAVAGQGDPALGFGVRGARLGVLARHAAHLHHRQAGAERQHHRHLQQHAERIAQDVGGEFGKALGAVPAQQHEGSALGGAAEAARRRRASPANTSGG